MTVTKKVITIKQGRHSLTTTRTIDTERGIETLEWSFGRGKTKHSGSGEFDLETGNPILPEGSTNNLRGQIYAEVIGAIRRASRKAAGEEDACRAEQEPR